MIKKITKLFLFVLGLTVMSIVTFVPVSAYAKKPIINVNKQGGQWTTNPISNMQYIGYDQVSQTYNENNKSWQLVCRGRGILECCITNNVPSSSTFTTPLGYSFMYNTFNEVFVTLNATMDSEVSRGVYRGTTTKTSLATSVDGESCGIIFEIEWNLDSNGNGVATIYVDDYTL